MTDNNGEIVASGGWCAPSVIHWDPVGEMWSDVFDPLRIRQWPPGLTVDDLDWIAGHVTLAEVDPDPMALPGASVRRGGIRFPVPTQLPQENIPRKD